jgi:hypothetical protein
MNKRLFVLICSVILFQYIYSTACTESTLVEGEGDTFTQEVCNKREGSETEICVLNSGQTGCELKAKTEVDCGDLKAGASDALCLSLKTNDGQLCIKKSDNDCEEKAKGEVDCDRVVSGVSDASACEGLKPDNDYNCVKDDNACKKIIKECQNGNGSTDAQCNKFSTAAGYVCKKDTDPDKTNKCKPVKDESATSATSSSYSLKFSLALLILLSLF